MESYLSEISFSEVMEKLYKEKLKPLETEYHFCDFALPPMLVLGYASFVDTPAIRNRHVKTIQYRKIILWCAQKCDMILLFFDLHKPEICAEFKWLLSSLRGHEHKFRIVIYSVDGINPEKLTKAYGSLMWSLGKVINRPIACRAYIGFSEKVKNDFLNELKNYRKPDIRERIIMDFAKRAKDAKIHACIMSHLKKKMPFSWGITDQFQICDNLEDDFEKVSKKYGIPLEDLPRVDSSSQPSPPSAFSSWNPLDQNPCKWSFITCTSDYFVSEINIQSIQLALPFPSNISTLSHLQKLTISSCNLTGSIPESVGDSLQLTLLDLSSNGLVGYIPRTIGKLKNLQDLTLNSNQLTGKIPAELGDCISLENLSLFDNNFNGELPVELGRLINLQALRAGGNKDISGPIPEELGQCQNLTVLGLADTKISGSLPRSLGQLRKLDTIAVYTTMLSGEIPPELGNCSELVNLYLYQNSLSGSIPKELGRLEKLEKLLLWQNNLSGAIPEEIGNISSLVIIDLSLNTLSGTIPLSFGNLPNLLEIMLSSNNISGSIPSVLSNAANLVQLQVDNNQITGSVPAELGRLSGLQILFAWQNRLEGSIPSALANCSSLQALDLSHNSLTGSLPSGLFQLQNLTKLLLISNHISGSIPPEIGNCKSLVRLRLFNNRIIGEIPKEIGFLGSLSFLDLSYNRLSGSVPEEISKCKELQMLNLSNNTIRGSIPDALSSLSKLQALDLSYNQLTGPIPDGFGQLDSINSLILRGNSLSGSIPSSLGSCLELQLIDLSSNGFSGRIPQELFQIQDLDIALNLSCNNLSGVIPPQISSLKKLNILDMSHNRLEGSLMQLSALDNLVSLNVSYNNFTGFLPDNKLFRQLSSKELEGNQGLCSQNHDSCFVGDGIGSDTGHSRQSKKLKLAIGLLVALTVILVALGVVAVARARKMIKDDSESEIGMNAWPWQFTPFQKLNFALDDVLKSLVESNIIGKGCSGIVYRAEMENGELIAVKKLWPATMGAKQDCHKDRFKDNGRDSFSGEVKTLGSIRHKNIVRFLGCCWNKNTRLLMYDYMPNGSLGSLLHERSGSCLDWDLRYKIILGAAQGLAYMHHDCVPPIVHRDIKVNNILIGLDFEPYIADFGLAKLVDDGDFARSSSTVAGSYGYMAPEYGYMMKVTEKSDVYSFGVVMLEVLTGKQPIDPTIPDGLHIVEWVRLRKGGADVIDQQLKGRSEPEVEEMMQTIGVALLCVTPTPNDRPTMKDVAAMLKEIRQDREADCTKADTVLKGSPMSKDQQTSNTNSSKGGPSTAMQQQLYTRSNNTSFSASSLLYSSSNGNITFK
uniref:Protein kinase domain-containing protein n=1 Tax=Chenopodium quinoa TaxID=63459 RepID=A0A803LAK1_CHEQI